MVNGKTLAQALKVAVVDAAQLTSREAAIAAGAGKWQSFTSFDLTGTLEATETATYGIVIYWEPTDNDNDFNMNNENKGNALSIDLGVKLLATQLNFEADSFGSDYDEDAELFDVIVTSEEELVAALAEATNGYVIGIKGNVTWTTGAGIGSTPFVEGASTYAVRPAGNTLTYITLQGVDENATFTAIGAGVGAVGIDNGTVVFKNLKIVDESVSYAENSWEYGYLEFRGNTVFENCEVVNAIMMEGTSAKFVNCSFNSYDNNQYAVWVSDGVATFENCTFNGARGLKVHEAYGSEVVSVSVNNSKFVELSKKPGLALGNLNADTAVSITNCQFIGTQAGEQDNYKYETDTATTTFDFVDENNTVAVIVSNGLYEDEDGTYYATNNTGLNAGIAAAQDGDTVVLGSDVTYTGNGYANITKDITLDLNGNNINVTSLGVVAKAGTIKNGTITNPVGGRAALRTWSGVSIENVTIISPENGGITVASGNTLPYIKDVTIVAKTYGIELQNYASVGYIENVTITAGTHGIVAQAATVGEIRNCTINGADCGIWAQLKGTEDLNLTITNCIVTGDKNYGLYVCDEGANIVPVGVATITYDENSTFVGGVKDMEFAFAQEGKLYVIPVVDGIKQVNAPIVVAPAPLEEDFLFPAGTNAVVYKDMAMSGNAQITHTENAVLGLSNVKAELDHDVIIRKSGGAIVIENSEFTLTDGAKLISVGEGGDAYQVFMVNVTINGVLMDSTTIWDYVEGISYISIVSEWPNT